MLNAQCMFQTVLDLLDACCKFITLAIVKNDNCFRVSLFLTGFRSFLGVWVQVGISNVLVCRSVVYYFLIFLEWHSQWKAKV